MFPALYEVVYFRGVFQIMRVIYDFILGWIPFPMVYILFLVLVQIIYLFLRFKGFKTADNPIDKIKSLFLPILSFVGAVIFFFYFLWGFNYQQKTLSNQLEFPKVEADSVELYNETIYFLNRLAELRTSISTDTNALSFDQLP